MSQIQSLSELMSMLRRRAWIIVLVTILGTIFSVWFALQQPRLYQSTAVIQVETPHVAEEVGATDDDARRRLQLIEQKLMSRENLIRMLETYDLFEGETASSLNDRIFQLRVSTDIVQIINGNTAWQAGAVPSGLSITVRYGDPQIAADLANAFARDAVELNRERRTSVAQETLAFFSSEEETLASRIDALENSLAAFKLQNADSLPDNLPSLRTQLAALRDDDLEIDQQILALESGTRARTSVVERQLGLLTEQKALIRARLDEVEAALAAAPAVERQFNMLSRELQKLHDQYSVITRRRAEAEMNQVLEERQQTERLEVLDPALPPDYPISASRRKMAMAGMAASVVLGFALAFVAEMMNPVIRSAAQLERVLDVSPVVSIPKVRTRGMSRWRIATMIGGALLLIGTVPVILRTIAERLGPLRFLGGN